MKKQIARMRASLRARRDANEFNRALAQAGPSQRRELLAAAARCGELD